MGFKDLEIKRSYSSDGDDVLFDFYLPVLGEAIRYDRLAGFFSSTSLAVAARGIINIINNNGVIRLIASPRLNQSDIEAIKTAYEVPEIYISDILIRDIEHMENEFEKDHVRALGWMLANNKLELKIALIHDDNGMLLKASDIEEQGIFHQKVGILYDGNNDIVSFSGSINETAYAWLKNIEEFKVFKSWEEIEKEYLKKDIQKFNRIWFSSSERVKVISAPDALVRNMIERAPKDIGSINFEKYYTKKQNRKVTLFDNQKKAVANWLKSKSGIFEMATGTGKTFTALGCLAEISDKHESLVTIIACPQSHLISQWRDDVTKFGVFYDYELVADANNVNWKQLLADKLMDIHLGHNRKIIIFTTHKTLSSYSFTSIIKEHKYDSLILLIADEVHGLGSTAQRKGLIPEYDMRLGLSATPKRWYDGLGSDVLYNYFGGVVYEFGLKQALNSINPSTGKTYLTPFKYKVSFVSLNDDEIIEYMEKTKIIVRNLPKGTENSIKDQDLEHLLFIRANIVKNAARKLIELEKIAENYPLSGTIIFCSPQQIDNVMCILARNGIVAHRFTENESTKPDAQYGGLSERDFLIKKFSEGIYETLVAIKCLDEGVDVPNARQAILMANSTNPREWIQRVGRVIRRSPGKEKAVIFDMIVIPSFMSLPPTLEKLERNIFQKELMRAKEMAKMALNNAETLSLLGSIEQRLIGRG